MNKETKSKCCGAKIYWQVGMFPDTTVTVCSACQMYVDVPQVEDTPVTPIEEKCMRCGIPKSKWKGRWQDPICKVGETSYDLHTSHLIEPSYTKQLKQKYLTYTDKGLELLIEEVEKAAEERGYEKGLAENPDNIYFKVSQQLTENGKEINTAIKALGKVYKDLSGISLQAK